MKTYRTIIYSKDSATNYDILTEDKVQAAVNRYTKEGYSARVLPNADEWVEYILTEIKKKHPQAARNRGIDGVRFYKSINDRSKYVEVHYLSISNSINGGVIPQQVREYFNL